MKSQSVSKQGSIQIDSSDIKGSGTSTAQTPEFDRALGRFIEGESLFRKVIEQVTDIVCIVNAGGEIKFLNKSVEKILGYTVAELESSKAATHALAEDRESIQRAMQVALENPGRTVAGDYRYCHQDGSVRVLHMTRQCFSSQASGNDAKLIVHARDITDQFQAERALRDSEERLRDFAETGADWFWEQDAELRFSYLSGNYPGFEKMSTDISTSNTPILARMVRR